MHSANLTTAKLKGIFLIISALFIYTLATAQENSPYSRYGIGDIVPNRNIVSRSMGGVSTGYSDYQSINLSNPATLGALTSTTFDLGGEIDIRTLKSNTTPDRFKSVNTNISYLQIGFPIAPLKWRTKGNSWGVSFGLRPVTRVNYKIQENTRLTNIDSLETQYEGSGGLNQANIATGIKLGNFSFGASAGYSFGNKNYSTRLTFINDTIPYAKSTTEINTNYGGVFVNAGLQYSIILDKKKGQSLTLGASANFAQSLKANKDNLSATFAYNANGEISHIDTVFAGIDQKGTVKLPASYSGGFSYADLHWVIGADVDFTQWSDYRSYGQKDAVKNNTTLRVGAQYFPAVYGRTPAKNYWSYVRYRAGLYYGNDYVRLSENRPDYALTLGAGLPLTSLTTRSYIDQFCTLNIGTEIGQRGNRSTQSIRESYSRILVGISMNAGWFRKRKYD